MCRIGQEAVWNWMLFLPSHHYPQTLTKGPNLPVPLNLCFKMKDISNEGSFLIPLFTERRRERQREGGRNRGKKGALEPHFPSSSSFSSGLEPLVGGEGKFLKKFLEFFCFPPINQHHHPLFFGREGEGKKAREKRKSKGKHG